MSNRVQAAGTGGKPDGVVQQIRARSAAELGLLGLAAAALLAARLALAVVPVKRLLARRSRPFRHGMVSGASGRVEQVRWAILTVTRHAPLAFVCFPQCLAASWLLRLRGYRSRLHYGVARTAGKLETHTWLECEGRILLGGEERHRFQEIAVY